MATAIVVPLASPANAATVPHEASLFSDVYHGFGPTRIVGVACPSSNVCLAVGGESTYGMLYRSTDAGATWTPDPVPGGSLDYSYDYGSAPLAISCGAPTFCVIEYATNSGDSSVDAFAVSTDEGLTWNGEPLPDVYAYSNSNVSSDLTDLTCTGTNTCLGIFGGMLTSGTTGAQNWTMHKVTAGATGVSCYSPWLCYVAQGKTVHGSEDLVVSSTLNRGGTLVPLLRVPSPGWIGPPVISCPTALACSVVTSGSQAELYTTFNGGRSWRSRQLFPVFAPQRVRNLQCTTPSECTLLVTDPTSQSTIDSLSTIDGGRSWSASGSVGRLGYPGAAAALNCMVTTSACLAAIGTHSIFSTANAQATSTAWTAAPIGLGDPTLSVVACTSGGDCLALGTGVRGASTDDGHTWTISKDQSLRGDVISSLTCPLPSTCVASGRSATSPSGVVLVTTDLGTTWTSGTVPWEVLTVGAVECASANLCVALPSFTTQLVNVPTFILRSTDGAHDWSLVQVGPPGEAMLTGVECSSTTSCIAVGAANKVAWVAVSSDGGATWTPQDPSSAGLGGVAPLEGIACTSGLHCETSTAAQREPYIYAYGTTDGGATWARLGTMQQLEVAYYFGGSPTMTTCMNGSCAGFSVNVVGPERPYYYVSLLVSADAGVTWQAFDAPYQTTSVDIALAPDGTAIAVGTNAEDGPLLLVGSA